MSLSTMHGSFFATHLEFSNLEVGQDNFDACFLPNSHEKYLSLGAIYFKIKT